MSCREELKNVKGGETGNGPWILLGARGSRGVGWGLSSEPRRSRRRGQLHELSSRWSASAIDSTNGWIDWLREPSFVGVVPRQEPDHRQMGSRHLLGVAGAHAGRRDGVSVRQWKPVAQPRVGPGARHDRWNRDIERYEFQRLQLQQGQWRRPHIRDSDA